MNRFLSYFEAGAAGAWLWTRIKGVWRRAVQRHRAKRQVKSLRERLHGIEGNG
jgi:hypothetical protein